MLLEVQFAMGQLKLMGNNFLQFFVTCAKCTSSSRGWCAAESSGMGTKTRFFDEKMAENGGENEIRSAECLDPLVVLLANNSDVKYIL